MEDNCIKNLFTEQFEEISKSYDFDSHYDFRVKKKEYRPLDLEVADSSDSEPDHDIYDPLFVKSI